MADRTNNQRPDKNLNPLRLTNKTIDKRPSLSFDPLSCIKKAIKVAEKNDSTAASIEQSLRDLEELDIEDLEYSQLRQVANHAETLFGSVSLLKTVGAATIWHQKLKQILVRKKQQEEQKRLSDPSFISQLLNEVVQLCTSKQTTVAQVKVLQQKLERMSEAFNQDSTNPYRNMLLLLENKQAVLEEAKISTDTSTTERLHLCCQTSFVQGQLIEQGECENYEFKNYFLPPMQDTHLKKIGETICGFVNNVGGFIYIGVKENLDKSYVVTGVKLSQQNKQEFENTIRNLANRIYPDIVISKLFTIQYIPVRNSHNPSKYLLGRYVIKISIKQGELDKLYCFEGKHFMRVNEEVVFIKNSQEEIERRHKQKSRVTPKKDHKCMEPQKGSPYYYAPHQPAVRFIFRIPHQYSINQIQRVIRDYTGKKFSLETDQFYLVSCYDLAMSHKLLRAGCLKEYSIDSKAGVIDRKNFELAIKNIHPIDLNPIQDLSNESIQENEEEDETKQTSSVECVQVKDVPEVRIERNRNKQNIFERLRDECMQEQQQQKQQQQNYRRQSKKNNMHRNSHRSPRDQDCNTSRESSETCSRRYSSGETNPERSSSRDLRYSEEPPQNSRASYTNKNSKSKSNNFRNLCDPMGIINLGTNPPLTAPNFSSPPVVSPFAGGGSVRKSPAKKNSYVVEMAGPQTTMYDY